MTGSSAGSTPPVTGVMREFVTPILHVMREFVSTLPPPEALLP